LKNNAGVNYIPTEAAIIKPALGNIQKCVKINCYFKFILSLNDPLRWVSFFFAAVSEKIVFLFFVDFELN
jgi:hypothetical protein